MNEESQTEASPERPLAEEPLADEASPAPEPASPASRWKALVRQCLEGHELLSPLAPEQSIKKVNLVWPLVLALSPNLSQRMGGPEGEGFDGRIEYLKERMSFDLGVPFPEIRLRHDCQDLQEETYTIRLNEQVVSRGRIPKDRVRIEGSYQKLREIFDLFESKDSIDLFGGAEIFEEPHPVYQTPTCWVPEELRERIESLSMECSDFQDHLLEHLTAICRRYVTEFLWPDEVQQLLDTVQPNFPQLYSEVMYRFTLLQLTDIFKQLVQEGVSIQDLRTLLGSLAKVGQHTTETHQVVEQLREALKQPISRAFSEDGSIRGFILAEAFEERLRDAVRSGPSGTPYLDLCDPEEIKRIHDLFQADIPRTRSSVLVVHRELRRPLYDWLHLTFPYLAVLSFGELHHEVPFYPISQIERDEDSRGRWEDEEHSTWQTPGPKSEPAHDEPIPEAPEPTRGLERLKQVSEEARRSFRIFRDEWRKRR